MAVFEEAPVDVVNEALGQLGKDFLQDLNNPDDPVAVKCLRYYRSLLRTLLRKHSWNFAKDRRELAQNTVLPFSRWSYSYLLPPDCFRVLRVNGNSRSMWELEGRNLLSQESRVIIEFIKWVEDPNVWDGEFKQAFVTYLAVRFAPAFHTDVAKASDLYKLYLEEIEQAKATDGQEQSPESMECTWLTDDVREE